MPPIDLRRSASVTALGLTVTLVASLWTVTVAVAVDMSASPAGPATPVSRGGPPSLAVPRVLATGLPVPVSGRAAPRATVRLERRTPAGWRPAGTLRAGRAGRFAGRVRIPGAGARRRTVLRAVSGDGVPGRAATVRVRPVTLAAVGDVNLGAEVAQLVAEEGAAAPWRHVAGALRRPDLAFANLECAISTRGVPFPKQFTFRAPPSSLAGVRDAGIDVVNLANNHVGDFGRTALLDTVRAVRRNGIVPVGAGHDAEAAAAPVVVRRLGLRIAFVGFSEVLPQEFEAGAGRPGTNWATPEAVRRGVAAARRRADVVLATFHWGIEKDPLPGARQRELAAAAFEAGADLVIGAHPHVLQPVERRGRRLVAWSLGNFVFTSGAPETRRTGILELELGAGGVLGDRLRPATITGATPRLDGDPGV